MRAPSSWMLDALAMEFLVPFPPPETSSTVSSRFFRKIDRRKRVEMISFQLAPTASILRLRTGNLKFKIQFCPEHPSPFSMCLQSSIICWVSLYLSMFNVTLKPLRAPYRNCKGKSGRCRSPHSGYILSHPAKGCPSSVKKKQNNFEIDSGSPLLDSPHLHPILGSLSLMLRMSATI